MTGEPDGMRFLWKYLQKYLRRIGGVMGIKLAGTALRTAEEQYGVCDDMTVIAVRLETRA